MERKGSGFEKIISGYEFQVNYSEEKKPSFRSDRYQFTVVMLNISRASVQRLMKELENAQRIERKGGKRYGYWEVKE